MSAPQAELGSYYLLGPIRSNEKILLLTSLNKIPYFLTVVSGSNNTTELIFDPRVDSLTAAELNVDSASPGIRLSFSDDSGVLSYITTTSSGKRNVASSTDKADHLIQITTEVSSWNPPVEFLAGVHYSFNNQVNKKVSWKAYIPDTSSIKDGVPSDILMDSSGSPKIQFIDEEIRVLPTVWYQANTCDSIKNVQSVVAAETIWVTGTGEVPDGYTDLDECKEGIRYSYCGPKQQCGHNCKGPCLSGGGSICMYDSGKDAFDCAPPPRKQDPYYKQPWFWALIIVSLVFLFFIVVIFIVRLAH